MEILLPLDPLAVQESDRTMRPGTAIPVSTTFGLKMALSLPLDPLVVPESALAMYPRAAIQVSKTFGLKMGLSLHVDPPVQESDLATHTRTMLQVSKAYPSLMPESTPLVLMLLELGEGIWMIQVSQELGTL
jgi:hypothetical protein